jgi:hypothetical protein
LQRAQSKGTVERLISVYGGAMWLLRQSASLCIQQPEGADAAHDTKAVMDGLLLLLKVALQPG